MKSKFNPLKFLLNSFIRHLKMPYEKCFCCFDDNSNNIKLEAFVCSLIDLLEYKRIIKLEYYVQEDKITLIKDSKIYATFDTHYMSSIKKEESLKFHLFMEWGFILNNLSNLNNSNSIIAM